MNEKNKVFYIKKRQTRISKYPKKTPEMISKFWQKTPQNIFPVKFEASLKINKDEDTKEKKNRLTKEGKDFPCFLLRFLSLKVFVIIFLPFFIFVFGRGRHHRQKESVSDSVSFKNALWIWSSIKHDDEMDGMRCTRCFVYRLVLSQNKS